ncbi:MAG: hypothetical protein ACKVKF_03045 [Rhodobacterales bacterium]|nr:hypothetical protein [Puniceibacterium antarcticum]
MAVSAMASGLGAALAALTIGVVNSAREIKNFAAISNAPVDVFQKWAAAAESVDIGQDKLADILKDVNDRVGDFLSTGGGPMADFFENIAPKVGVTAEQFRKLSGPQALQLYVSSLEQAGLSQGEMTFYLEAMASDLTNLVPLLRNNGAELDRLGGRAAQFGAVLSGETIEAMKGAKASLGEVALVFKGFAYQIATEMVPVITAFADGFTSLAVKGGPLNTLFTSLAQNILRISTYVGTAATLFGVRYVAALVAARLATLSFAGALAFLRGALVRTGIGALVVGAGELVYWFGRVVTAAGGVGEGISRIYDVGKATFLAVGNTAWGLLEIMAGVASAITGSFVRAFAEIAKSWDMLVNGMAGAWNALAESSFGSTLGMGSLGSSDLGGAMGSVADGLFDSAENSIVSGGERIKAAGQSVADAVAASLVPINGAAGDLEDGAAAADRLAGALDGVAESAGGGGKGAKGVKSGLAAPMSEAAKAAKSAGEAIRGTMTDSFKGVVTQAMTMGEALANVFSKISDMMLDSVGNAVFSGISSSLGSMLTASIPGFANGTNSAPGGMAWVGEQGRELVNLPRGAQVIPNHKLGQGGGGGAMRVEVVPSDYFDVRVSSVSRQANAPMIQGAAKSGQVSHGARSERYYQRGTMT